MYSSEIKLVHTHLYGYVDAWAAEPTCMHTYMYVQYIYTHTHLKPHPTLRNPTTRWMTDGCYPEPWEGLQIGMMIMRLPGKDFPVSCPWGSIYICEYQ